MYCRKPLDQEQKNATTGNNSNQQTSYHRLWKRHQPDHQPLHQKPSSTIRKNPRKAERGKCYTVHPNDLYRVSVSVTNYCPKKCLIYLRVVYKQTRTRLLYSVLILYRFDIEHNTKKIENRNFILTHFLTHLILVSE